MLHGIQVAKTLGFSLTFPTLPCIGLIVGLCNIEIANYGRKNTLPGFTE